MGESGESGEGTNSDKGGTNGDKSSPCGGSVAASRSGAGSAQTVIGSGGDGQQIPSGPSASRTRASSRTPSAPRTPSVNATASVNESQEHQKKTLDPVVEEALPDAPAVEDEVLYPGYVQHNNDEEDAADKEYIPAEFSDADEDEKKEDVEMGVFEDAAEDRPVEIYDRENPCIAEGVVFPSAVDCRNAVASFSIKSETEFLTLKSDPTRFTVKCAYESCKWRLHASLMRNSTLFRHTCPSVNRSQRLRAAKRRWIADASMSWIRANPGIGPKEIQTRLLEKYGVEVPYDRFYHGKEIALDKLYGKYGDSFQLLYSFKAEVERFANEYSEEITGPFHWALHHTSSNEGVNGENKRFANEYSEEKPNRGRDEHSGADNADDHPTTNEPAQAEIQEEEEEDETTPDVQQQMPPPRSPHMMHLQKLVVQSGRGPSPRCVKQNIGVEQELESKGSSPKRAATTVEAPNPAKNTRSKAMQAPNPAKNTRSKKLMF
ncbi:hypothetical protein D1007_48573 [Hordeum vulgare]|nr:hypothetical protein D1007_48573 [Hordeum vulgare]